MAPAILVVIVCLGLTAGAAAASGVNLRSVAGDVVDTLAEPLPLSGPPPSAEGHLDAIGLVSGERAGGTGESGGEPPIRPSGEGSLGDDDAASSVAPDDGASDNANLPVQGSPHVTDPPGNHPHDNPPADGPAKDENQGGHHETPPGDADPPSPAPSPSGSGNPSNGNNGGPDGSNGGPSNRSNGGPDGSNPGPSNHNHAPDGSNGDPADGNDGGPNASDNPSGGTSGDDCGGESCASNPVDKGSTSSESESR